jgi:hypothetical protein
LACVASPRLRDPTGWPASQSSANGYAPWTLTGPHGCDTIDGGVGHRLKPIGVRLMDTSVTGARTYTV